jgi:hypothetical protein
MLNLPIKLDPSVSMVFCKGTYMFCRKANITVTIWKRNKWRLRNYGIFILILFGVEDKLHWCTAALVYSYTGAQLHWCTAALVRSCTCAQLHWCTAALVRSCTGVQLHWCTAALVHSCTGVQLRVQVCHTLIQERSICMFTYTKERFGFEGYVRLQSGL